MALSNYSELKTSVADFLNRDDLTSVIPDFVKLAEVNINSTLRHWRMENRATAELSGQYLATPANFLEPIRLHLESDFRPIELVSVYRLQTLRRNASNTTGTPTNYALVQGEFEFFPSPDATYNVEMTYYASVAPLSDSNTQNVILQNFPDLYLYGSLSHSAPYLADDARLPVWSSLYASGIETANKQSGEGKYGGSGLRMKIRSY